MASRAAAVPPMSSPRVRSRSAASDSGPLVLGIDLGSSAAKAVLADGSGCVVARATVAQRVSRPEPGAAEQAADEWWEAVRGLVAATLGRVGRSARGRVASVGVSGHYPTLLLCDAAGRPLAPAMLYADTRSDPYVAAASRLAGRPLLGDEWLPKLLWLAKRRPALLARARMLCDPHDHVAFRLTGRRGLDHRSAMRAGGLFDPARLAWRDDVRDALGIAPEALPPLRRAGEVVGEVSAAGSRASGLPSGTPVVVGLGDTPAELLGAGVVRQGDALLYYGTTTTADVCTHDFEAYLRDPSPIVEWAPYHEVAYAVIGPALPWIAAGLETPADERAPDLARLDAEAARIRPAPGGPFVLPHFLAHARSDAPHPSPAIVGLDVGHGRADLHRALLESFAFTARAGLEAAGFDASAMRFVAAGGGARSDFWRQLVSDVLGVPQAWAPDADAALGSARLAAWGVGLPGTFAPGAWSGTPGPSTLPDAAVHQVEDARYRTWLRLRDALAAAVTDVAAESRAP